MQGCNPWTALWLTKADACKRLLVPPSALLVYWRVGGFFRLELDQVSKSDSTKSNTLKRTKGIGEPDPVRPNNPNTIKGEPPLKNLSFIPRHRRSRGIYLLLFFLLDLGNIRSGTASADFPPFSLDSKKWNLLSCRDEDTASALFWAWHPLGRSSICFCDTS